MNAEKGTTIHVVMADKSVRAATVTNNFGPDSEGRTQVNATLDLDLSNDVDAAGAVKTGLLPERAFAIGLSVGISSAPYDIEGKEPGTWHLPY
jgi:hypothetical protein